MMKTFALPFLVLAGLAASSVSAADVDCNGPNARTIPPTGAIVVDATGVYNGSFRNITEAVANIPNTTDEHTLFFFPGVYHEQVLISKLRGPLVLQGYCPGTMKWYTNFIKSLWLIHSSDFQTEDTYEKLSIFPFK